MFEGFKTLASMGGENAAAKAASAELIKLIRVAREQKTMLEAALNQVETKSSSLSQTAKSLERVEKRAVTAGGRLDDLEGQAAALTSQTRSLDEAASKIDAVIKRGEAAEQLVIRLTAPDGQLETHRQALQRLDAQAAETRASIDALSQERAVVEDVRRSLRDAQGGAAQSAEQLARLQAELQVLRGQAPRARRRVRQAESHGARRARVCRPRHGSGRGNREEENRRAHVAGDELSNTTEERLASLTSLAEHCLARAQGARRPARRRRTCPARDQPAERDGVGDARPGDQAVGDSGKHITRTEELLERLEMLLLQPPRRRTWRPVPRPRTSWLGTFAKDAARREGSSRTSPGPICIRVGLSRAWSPTRSNSASPPSRRGWATSRRGSRRPQPRNAAWPRSASASTRPSSTRRGTLGPRGRVGEATRGASAPSRTVCPISRSCRQRTATQMDYLARARQDLDVLRGEFQDLSHMTVEVAKTRELAHLGSPGHRSPPRRRLAAFHARLPEIRRQPTACCPDCSRSTTPPRRPSGFGEALRHARPSS